MIARRGMEEDEGMNTGWICPKCANVYGPNVAQCSSCNENNRARGFGGAFKWLDLHARPMRLEDILTKQEQLLMNGADFISTPTKKKAENEPTP